MKCDDFREAADLYRDNEPARVNNNRLRQHLESCADCRQEVAARSEVRAALRRAATQSPNLRLRPEFAFRLRNDLKATLEQPKRESTFAKLFAPFLTLRPQWLAVAACLIVAAMVGFVALTSRQTSTGAPIAQVEVREPNAIKGGGAAVRLARFEQTKTAVGDHRFCALDYQLEEEPIPLDEAGRFDAAYTGLEQAVMAGQNETAGSFTLVEEHACVYNGQRFAHVVLEHHGCTVSVLMTEKPEALNPTLAAPVSTPSNPISTPADQVTACAQIEGYQVSCFETKRHIVYTVSDLSEAENLVVARLFASSVSKHITQAEAAA